MLIAHDNRKADMLEWARFNRETLGAHELYATGTTGALIAAELELPVTRFLCNVPMACNRAMADFILSSPLLAIEYRGSHAVEPV